MGANIQKHLVLNLLGVGADANERAENSKFFYLQKEQIIKVKEQETIYLSCLNASCILGFFFSFLTAILNHLSNFSLQSLENNIHFD